MYFDYVIIGADLYGLTLAERITTETDNSVLILEESNTIGGDIKDYGNLGLNNINKEIIKENRIFLTNEEHVWRYLGNFTKWRNLTICNNIFKYVGVPSLGYTHMFKNMLGTKSKVILNVDNFKFLDHIKYKELIFCDEPEHYSYYKFGKVYYSLDKSVDNALKYFYRNII